MRELTGLAATFLRLGATSFGGPAVHIAMMEDELVTRRAWVSHEEFLDLVSASQLIPGPNSTELAIHLGYRRAGWPGLIIAGLSFILPAMLVVWGVAWSYVRYGSLPAVGGALEGMKPVLVALLAQATIRFGRTALTSAMTLTLFVASLLGLALGAHEVLVLALAGAIALLDRRVTAGGDPWRGSARLLLPVATGPATAAAASAFSLSSLLLVFLKAGALLFGSGYVLFAFLRADLVTRLGWLTESQLLDAIAVGQFTPGPLFTTATFIGYLLAGNAGALVATLGIFLPAFVFVAVSAPALVKWRTNRDLRALLDGVNAASLAMIVGVTLLLARGVAGGALAHATVSDAHEILRAVVPLVLFVVGGLVLARTRLNPAWLMLGGAVTGLALNWPR